MCFINAWKKTTKWWFNINNINNINVNCITDNKNFWRVVKPNFSNKIVGTNRVMLRDGAKIISDKEKVADTFNKFLVNIGNNV